MTESQALKECTTLYKETRSLAMLMATYEDSVVMRICLFPSKPEKRLKDVHLDFETVCSLESGNVSSPFFNNVTPVEHLNCLDMFKPEEVSCMLTFRLQNSFGAKTYVFQASRMATIEERVIDSPLDMRFRVDDPRGMTRNQGWNVKIKCTDPFVVQSVECEHANCNHTALTNLLQGESATARLDVARKWLTDSVIKHQLSIQQQLDQAKRVISQFADDSDDDDENNKATTSGKTTKRAKK